MAAELGILSLTQLQRVAQQQQQLNSGNWNSNGHRPAAEDDGPWEARTLAKDIGGAMWPSRSYTCTFCNREFRSAQALGGHMNVHRRDRARLCQSPGPDPSPPSTPSITFSSQEFDTGGGLCLFYPAPDTDLPPTSPHQGSPARDFLAGMGGKISHCNLKDGMAADMLDLELRL